jgi:arylsulfatase A-like enzyme
MKLNKSVNLFATLSLVCSGNMLAESPKVEVHKKPHFEKPRNIIFILADDHRYDYLGFMHTIPWLQTPNLDKMASEGAWIKNAFVTTSLSSPSRATILTGLYAHQHEVIDNVTPRPSGLLFFPQYLQKVGYVTGFFGKWHMGNASGTPEPGFDQWEGFKGQGEYWNPLMNVNGKWIQTKDSTYTTDYLTKRVLKFIKKTHADGKPFFVYLGEKASHDPFNPPKRYLDCYKDSVVPLPASFNNPDYGIPSLPTKDTNTGKPLAGPAYYGKDMKPDWLKNQRESWHGVDWAYNGRMPWQDEVRRYCETLRGLDDNIGEIMNYLKKNGLDKNTLIIYMGDNGVQWGEHGIIDKRTFYEASVRVPMLVWDPGVIKPKTIVNNMVQNLDIAPTILDYAGIVKPSQMEGESFMPIVEGKNIPWNHKLFYEYYWEFNYPMTPTTFGVRTDKYKFIRYYGLWDTDEFYDLKNDPYELHNLIAAPQFQDTIKSMVHDLYGWLKRTKGMYIPLKETEQSHGEKSGDWRNKGDR